MSKGLSVSARAGSHDPTITFQRTVAESVRQSLVAVQNNPNIVVATSVTAVTATTVPWAGVTGTPTTLAGYGITSPLDAAEGGTGHATYAVGDLVYASGIAALARLPVGTASQFLRVNAGATAPEWASGAALTKTDDTNVTLTLGGSPTTALLAATSVAVGWTGQLSVARGGTSFGSYTTGDIVYATGATAFSKLGIGATNTVMVSTGSAPSWAAQSTLTAPAGLLTGTTLASNVVTSSLTTIGTLIAGQVNAQFVTSGTFGSASGDTGDYKFPTGIIVGTLSRNASIGAALEATASINVVYGDASASTGTAYRIANIATGAAFYGYRANGTAVTPTAIVSGNNLGNIAWGGYDGTNYNGNSQAAMFAQATQNWNATSRGTKLFLQTTPNGSLTLTTALTLDQDQSATFAGTITSGLINGQTISSAANFTGSVAMGALTATTGTFSGIVNITTGNAANFLTSQSATTGYSYMRISNTGGFAILAVEGSVAGVVVPGSLAYATTLFTNTSTALQFGTNSALNMTIAAGGAISMTSTLGVTGDFSVNTSKFTVAASSGNMTSAGLTTTYNGVATAGHGVAAVRGYGRLTAQTAAVTLCTFSPASDGSFVVSGNLLITVSTNFIFSVAVSYKDESNVSRTLVLGLSPDGGGVVQYAATNPSGAIAYGGVPVCIRAKGGTTITVATSGTFTTVTYNAEAIITQVN